VKVLICSNAPWAKTGYGLQAASLATRLQDDGHTVAFHCNYGLQGGVLSWRGITCFPNGLEGGYADKIIYGHIRTFQPDLVFTLFDIWVLQNQEFPLPGDQGYVPPRWAAWIPIDHSPVSPHNLAVVPHITYPIAMSQHGSNELTRLGIKHTYIPHGVEKDYHFTAAGRREFRRLLLLPDDAFLFGSVGLNRHFPCRKGFDRLMAAFKEMPKNAYLYLHTLPTSQVGSMDLNKIAAYYEIADRVIFPDTYNYVMGYSQAGMNAIYSAIDCYVHPTHGEGFGLPVLEAQACGCPVIATDCTSMPELCAPFSSELVAGGTLFVCEMGNRVLIDEGILAEKMKSIMGIYYDDPKGYMCMRANAGLWANSWDWDKLWIENWRPFLADVQRDIDRAPRQMWHRGAALVFEHEGRMRKQDSRLCSPASKKELALYKTLSHPNIIPILDSGVDPIDGTTWFDMPMYTPLRDMTDISDEQADRILAGIESALHYLHAGGVAHRDVCPSNVVVDAEGHPYLVDFEWAAQCEGEPCVDFEPWAAMENAAPLVQRGGGERGFYTIVAYLKGKEAADLLRQSSSSGLAKDGVPYQPVEGLGPSERDCSDRWDILGLDVKGKRLLDIGCNAGWFVRKALEEGAVQAVGVDSDVAIIKLAKSLGGGDYYTMPAASVNGQLGHFDIVLLLSVLQHIEHPAEVLATAKEIGKEVYVEIPHRFITPALTEQLEGAESIGESERGRPMFKVGAK